MMMIQCSRTELEENINVLTVLLSLGLTRLGLSFIYRWLFWFYKLAVGQDVVIIEDSCDDFSELEPQKGVEDIEPIFISTKSENYPILNRLLVAAGILKDGIEAIATCCYCHFAPVTAAASTVRRGAEGHMTSRWQRNRGNLLLLRLATCEANSQLYKDFFEKS